MDGQNRTKLVDSKIVFPHGITLDLVNRLVYWADAYLDYIEVVDYEGKNRHTIIQGILVSGARGRSGSGTLWQSVPEACLSLACWGALVHRLGFAGLAKKRRKLLNTSWSCSTCLPSPISFPK